MSQTKQQRRQYTLDEKRHAVALAQKKGRVAAAQELSISLGSLANWMPGGRAAVDIPRPVATTPKAPPQAAPAKAARTATTEPAPTTPRPAKAQAIAKPAPPPAELVPPTATAAPRSVAKIYTPSQKAVILEEAAKMGVTDAAKKHDVSRFSVYEWRRQLARAAAGKGPSPTSGPDPKDIEAQRDKEILNEWHHQPGLGPSQIKNQLRRKGVKVAVHTVREVMIGAGYRPPKVARHDHDERFEAVRPQQLWHLDFLHRNINKTSVFTLILIDDHSRFVVGHGLDDAERADMVIQTFEAAVARHGKPEMVLHDKGSAFWSWRGISRFTALLVELGIDQIPAEHKEWNGKSEVFNANLAKELFDVQRFYDVAELRRRLEAHLHWYNHRRTHHALGGLLVPADRYYGRAEEVLARIEAGAGAEVSLDALDLRDRVLDLFKVTSRDGKPEVWLMGRKIPLGG